ncbi:hypothetical protein VTN02DRAFT_185 [Thermoascus thermophilus]
MIKKKKRQILWPDHPVERAIIHFNPCEDGKRSLARETFGHDTLKARKLTNLWPRRSCLCGKELKKSRMDWTGRSSAEDLRWNFRSVVVVRSRECGIGYHGQMSAQQPASVTKAQRNASGTSHGVAAYTQYCVDTVHSRVEPKAPSSKLQASPPSPKIMARWTQDAPMRVRFGVVKAQR